MAKSNNNPLTHGLSGAFGNIMVFRQLAGKTIVANMPKQSEVPPSKKQLKVRLSFREAGVYAENAMKDPAIKAMYQAKVKPGLTARNIAVKEFFKVPDITDVNVSGYTGKAGDIITMRVTDYVVVTGVMVRIENSDGSLLEEGAAVMGDNGLDYMYTATENNRQVPGSKVMITATNLPDNKAESITTL